MRDDTGDDLDHLGSSPGMRRVWRNRVLIAVVAAPIAFVLAVVVSFVRCMAEQLTWRPRDSSRIKVEDIKYAPQGIALTVRSSEAVAAVWRQQVSFLPWLPQHVASGFRARRIGDGIEQVLVEYQFVPEREWLLALQTADGFWVYMSPYFSGLPDMDQKAWSDTWSSAERRVPR